jgi:hypothetical protein
VTCSFFLKLIFYLNFVSFLLILDHGKCKKFHSFLVKEFARLFSMYLDLGKKEQDTNEKLILALEKCDELTVEKEELERVIDDYREFYG